MNPYSSPIVGDDSKSDKPIIRKMVVSSFHFGHLSPEPSKLSLWITNAVSKATSQGMTKLHITAHEDPGDENNFGTYYLQMWGERLENKKELDGRLLNIRRQWLRDFEAFERQRKYYESEQGKAEILESRRAEGL